MEEKTPKFTISVHFDYERILERNIDPEVLDEELMQLIRLLWYKSRKAVEEIQNLALVEIDGLVQLVRVDYKEYRGAGAEYFVQ